jgi:TatA/E family protein of Tat protein translocase
MGPLGWQETVLIFIIALLLFGPKKLPELGKTIGKAITEFRRASNELKATFDRELGGIKQEVESIKEVTRVYDPASYIHDYDYESSRYDGSSDSPSNESTATESLAAGAAATEGAESTSGTAPAPAEAAAVTAAAPEAPGAAAGEPAAEDGVTPAEGPKSAAS